MRFCEERGALVAASPARRWVNAGEIANSGFELTVRGTPLQNPTLAWDLVFNMGTNSNEVLDLAASRL